MNNGSGGAITVEELQILITAKYGDALKDIAKMASEVSKKMAPVQKQVKDALEPNIKPMKQAVKQSATDASRLAETMKVAADAAERIAKAQKEKRERSSAGSGRSQADIMQEVAEAQKRNQAALAKTTMLERERAKFSRRDDLIQQARAMTNVAEQANKAAPAFEKIAESSKKLGNNISKISKGSGVFSKLAKSIAGMTKNFAIFGIIMKVSDAIVSGFESIAQSSERANSTLSAYISSFSYLSNTLTAVVMPILTALEPVITRVVDLLADALNYVGMFLAALSGQKTYTRAVKIQKDYAESLNGTAEAANRAKYALAGFDELNILDFGNDAAKIENVEQAFEEVEIPEWMQTVSDVMNRIYDFFGGLKKNDNKGLFDPQPVEEFASVIDAAREKVGEFVHNLEKVPGINLGAFKKTKEEFQEPIESPEFEPVTAPAINLETAFVPSRNEYRETVDSPAIDASTAPAIDTEGSFIPSRNEYQETVESPVICAATAPEIESSAFAKTKEEYTDEIPSPPILQAVAPAIDIQSKYKPSLEQMSGITYEIVSEATLKLNQLFENLGVSQDKTLIEINQNLYNSLNDVQKTTVSAYQNVSDSTVEGLENVSSNVDSFYDSYMKNTQTATNFFEKRFPNVLGAVDTAVTAFSNSSSGNFAEYCNNLQSSMSTTVNVIRNMAKMLETAEGDPEKAMNLVKGVRVVSSIPIIGTIAAAAGKAIPGLAKTALSSGTIGSKILKGFPHLANGAVITSPTMALMGEYSGAMSNPEIVAPQNIIYDTVVEANAPLVTAMYNMVQEIIMEIRNKETTVEIDGDTVGRTAQRWRESYYKRTGDMLL